MNNKVAIYCRLSEEDRNKKNKSDDGIRRMVRTKYGRKTYILLKRLRCVKCCSVHRELPNDILPYKHYDSEIIQGVIEGMITSETLEFEDYPCEMTMKRWKTH